MLLPHKEGIGFLVPELTSCVDIKPGNGKSKNERPKDITQLTVDIHVTIKNPPFINKIENDIRKTIYILYLINL